ncbi:MAG: hypothetical protein ACI9NC_000385 [Verrucomicrobiales bacterium]|jgi:hypothetical protein
MDTNFHNPNRRNSLRSFVAGSAPMPGILRQLAAAEDGDPLTAKQPHFPARAKNVIFLFMTGGGRTSILSIRSRSSLRTSVRR